MKLAQEVECLFPNKARVYEQMRELEETMNDFIKQKLLNVKEELLVNGPKGVKRTLRIMAEVFHSNPGSASSEWKLRLDGRLLGETPEE